jgi:hypothetical protein
MTNPVEVERPLSAPVEDKRLDRLLDYTKFHVGIYLSIGGGLMALLGAASKADEKTFLNAFIGNPKALALAFLFMVLAGFAGGLMQAAAQYVARLMSYGFNRKGHIS